MSWLGVLVDTIPGKGDLASFLGGISKLPRVAFVDELDIEVPSESDSLESRTTEAAKQVVET